MKTHNPSDPSSRRPPSNAYRIAGHWCPECSTYVEPFYLSVDGKLQPYCTDHVALPLHEHWEKRPHQDDPTGFEQAVHFSAKRAMLKKAGKLSG